MTSKAAKHKKTEIKFGTDGWRGIIARDFTFENVRILTEAYAGYLNIEKKDSAERKIVIGFDCRFLAEDFAAETASVLENNGFESIAFAKPVPTPIVSWTVRDARALGGIVITASHNSSKFCGYKIKSASGGSVSLAVTSEIESYLYRKFPARRRISGERQERADEIISRAAANYRRRVEDLVEIDFISNSSEQSVVFDSMHGAGGTWIESFIAGGKIRSQTIRKNPDINFGGVNPEPVDKNLSALKAKVLKTRSVIGLASDGDADRIGAVNESGATMTMHEIAPILLLHLARRKNLKGAVVGTVSQSVLLKRIAEALDLPFYETPVGFKHIAELMEKTDVLIGAEESGGIGFKAHIPERDAILGSLLLLEAVLRSGKSPSDLVSAIRKEFGSFFYARTDLPKNSPAGKKLIERLKAAGLDKIAGEPVAEVRFLDGIKFVFRDESWLLFRQSGTEPLMRVYAEAASEKKLANLLEAGEKIIFKGI